MALPLSETPNPKPISRKVGPDSRTKISQESRRSHVVAAAFDLNVRQVHLPSNAIIPQTPVENEGLEVVEPPHKRRDSEYPRCGPCAKLQLDALLGRLGPFGKFPNLFLFSA
jgi:hypothetical protein